MVVARLNVVVPSALRADAVDRPAVQLDHILVARDTAFVVVFGAVHEDVVGLARFPVQKVCLSFVRPRESALPAKVSKANPAAVRLGANVAVRVKICTSNPQPGSD
jgi:hypothetical protein